MRAKRLRTQRIRRRTIRGSLTLFAVVWVVVFAQLLSGNDPALSNVPGHRHIATAKREPAREPEPVEEAESPVEAEPEPEVEFVPEEEATPEVEPEPEPIVTSAS